MRLREQKYFYVGGEQSLKRHKNVKGCGKSIKSAATTILMVINHTFANT